MHYQIRNPKSEIRNWKLYFSLATVLVVLHACHPLEDPPTEWPAITKETKPWTRWWWHGSAVTKEGITTEMEAYKKAGIGGLEITPIYGVYGQEDKFVNYLSSQWMELFIHTLKEAERLDLGIDLATGTGWPFGGPWVKADDACKNFHYKVYEIKAGESLREKIEFKQQPYLRLVGNQIYEVHDSFGGGEVASGSRKEPLVTSKNVIQNFKRPTIEQLVDPVEANENLQALALDQVIFEKPIPLQVLMAYSESGEVLDITSHVDNQGKLNWTPTKGQWKLYAIFQGWHGKMVERAAPGGEGNVIDHFSAAALKNYLSQFDHALKGHDIKSLRAFFNDSYEVDDARGSADWTPALFDEFKKRKGYDLKEHLPALLGKDDEDKNKRVLCDYRETISELLLENFTKPWKAWAHEKSAIIRNQAHGSPSNILDLYAAVDIPEIEGVEPLRTKMASSAANVTGKKLVSSESATWLNEHFESNLADIKVAVDQFLLNGVNHIFYHGTCYSPPDEPWPGWLFYAAVHLSPRNSLWDHFDALNNYVARCQSFLQNSSPDNDVLLYFPIYDRFSSPGNEMIEHFDGIGKQFQNTAFARSAETMLEKGYTFDYISDKQLLNTSVEKGKLKTDGNSVYTTLVLPNCKFIPIETWTKILSLVKQGVTVIAYEGLPESAAGFANAEENKRKFAADVNELKKEESKLGEVIQMKLEKGSVLLGDNLIPLLEQSAVRRERITDVGLAFIRKKGRANRTLYFVANPNDVPHEGWLLLQTKDASAFLYDPMTGRLGRGDVRNTTDGLLEVFVQLNPGETLLIETHRRAINAPPYLYFKTIDDPLELKGKWKITFESGGPVLPAAIETDSLISWTNFNGDAYKTFSGTATYTLNFSNPNETSKGWLLDLGNVKEAAQVFINGNGVGTRIGPAYQVYIDQSFLQENNVLEIKVSNLMANRIADLDKRGVFWKKFYNVNFPARKAENRKNGLFNASQWKPRDSGLLGPVYLMPMP